MPKSVTRLSMNGMFARNAAPKCTETGSKLTDALPVPCS